MMHIPESLEQVKQTAAHDFNVRQLTHYLQERYAYLLPKNETTTELMYRVDRSLNMAYSFQLTSSPDVGGFVVMDVVTHQKFYEVPELKNLLLDAQAPSDRRMMWMLDYANPASFEACFSLKREVYATQDLATCMLEEDTVYIEDDE